MAAGTSNFSSCDAIEAVETLIPFYVVEPSFLESLLY